MYLDKILHKNGKTFYYRRKFGYPATSLEEVEVSACWQQTHPDGLPVGDEWEAATLHPGSLEDVQIDLQNAVGIGYPMDAKYLYDKVYVCKAIASRLGFNVGITADDLAEWEVKAQKPDDMLQLYKAIHTPEDFSLRFDFA